MAINRRNKGYRTEKSCRDILEFYGYATDTKNASKFNSNDFFYLFDVIAIKNNKQKYIQVKSNPSDAYSAKKPIIEFAEKYKLDTDVFDIEIWLWYKYHGFRIWSLDKSLDGYQWLDLTSDPLPERVRITSYKEIVEHYG